MFQQVTSHPVVSLLSQALGPPSLPWQGWELHPIPAQDGEAVPKKTLTALRLPYLGSQPQDS